MEEPWALETPSQLQADALSLLQGTDTSLLDPEVVQEEDEGPLELVNGEAGNGGEEAAKGRAEDDSETSVAGESDGEVKVGAVEDNAPALAAPESDNAGGVILAAPAGKGAVKASTVGTRRSLSGTLQNASSPRPFLRSSSSAAAARRLSVSNGGEHEGKGGSNGNRTPGSSSASSGVNRRTGLSPATAEESKSASRRNSASPRTLALSTPKPIALHTESRRASLSGVSSSKPAVSPAELKKWASSPSARSVAVKVSAAKSSTPPQLSPRTVSKPGAETVKRATPLSLKSSSPSTRSSLQSPDSVASPRLQPSSLSSPRSQPSKPSPSLFKSPSLNGRSSSPAVSQKKLSPSSSMKRTPRASDSPASSASNRASTVSCGTPTSSGKQHSSSPLSADRGPSMLQRRKSLTSDSRDSRFISLPSVDSKAGDDVRLDLRGQKVRSLDGNLVNLTPKMEFVYLRDNKLSNLNGIEILRRVKVLDLSFNEFKGAGFEPLAGCKSLQQLYLAGNQITSLSGLPLLPNLEFLSVAQNKLKSLAMATQPKLQVLAASKNKISTFKGFPHLPVLEHLRLEENPILEVPHVEAASILLVGPTLKKFNDRDLSTSEVELAQMYPAHTAFCIRDGWEFTPPEEASESTLRFLTEQWEGILPVGYVLKKLSIERPMEEDPCRSDFLLEKEDGTDDSELDLRYQWFVSDKTTIDFVPIEGAVSKEYWPKHEDIGNYLKVECTPVIAGVESSPIHVISMPVSPGSGIPKVLRLDVEGELMEGCTLRGSAYVAWRGGTPSKGIVSWLRFTENGSPVAIVGAEDYEYQLTLDDIGANLVFMYTPMTDEGAKGESLHATTNLIQAAPPSVSNVHIVGEAVEENTIQGAGKYFGGKEGPSKFEWLREDPDSGEFKLVSRGNCEYVLTDEDVNLRLMFIYTPVNSQGVQGNPASIISSRVLRAPPRVTNLRIIGDIREGNKVALSATFIGGLEGASKVQWFKTTSPSLDNPNDFDAISISKIAKAFRIPLAAVGYYLVAKYTPVRFDGECGEPVFAVSETPVETLPPGLTSLSISGDFLEGETITGSYGYVGGHEGKSKYNWYLHDTESSPGFLVPEAASKLHYLVTKQAVNRFISFECIPVRDDGLVGEGRSTLNRECIRAGSPKLISLQIVGEAIEGAQLSVEKQYWGGEEGSSRLQWFLTRPDGAQREIRGAGGLSYTVRSEDIEGFLCVSCEPIRSDGVRGPVAVSQLLGPVLPSPPICKSLMICGALVEGQTLSFEAVYRGGEKGACLNEWHRKDTYGREHLLARSDTLHLTGKDVGSKIRLVFTPVRKDGMVGEPVDVLSDVVVDADPEGKELEIPDCCEDVEIIPRKVYFGGQEGEGDYAWYRTVQEAGFEEFPDDAQFLADSLSYTPKLEDVGLHLILNWIPSRKDGKRGQLVTAWTQFPVQPAAPSVHSVRLSEVSPGVFLGEGQYYGGLEGRSQMSWFRITPDGKKVLIDGATSSSYSATHDDYTCRLIFGYVPVRMDGVSGEIMLSEPSDVVYPELPRIHKIIFSGKPVEGEMLTALEVIPKEESQAVVWDKYKKETKYQWSRSLADSGTFENVSSRTCNYKVTLQDVGYCLQCECTVVDVFGRSGEQVSGVTTPVQPGWPKVEKLEIDGRGHHTSLYAVRGIYFGGKEGTSSVQWFRSMAGSPDLIPIAGETGRMYEANVDDVSYNLVAIYTPVREDGVEGAPTSASSEPITVDPEVAKEVKQKIDLGVVKCEALRDRDRSPMKGQQQALGCLEKRTLDVNKKRVKVVKPGSKTSFPSTELRGTYSPPFHVELVRSDQLRLKIVFDLENEIELMVQSRHLRDVLVLVLRGLAQKYNSTSLNTLLKI